MSEGRYHVPESCNNCGEGVNDIEVVDSLDVRMHECKTKCRSCGHKDYWAYGFFESGMEMVSKCKKY